MAWIEIQEPTLTPGPLETGHISPEEEEQQMLKNRFLLSNDFFDGEDEGLPQVYSCFLLRLFLSHFASFPFLPSFSLPDYFCLSLSFIYYHIADTSTTGSGHGILLPRPRRVVRYSCWFYLNWRAPFSIRRHLFHSI